MQHASLRKREIKPAPRAGERDVHEPAFLLDTVGLRQAVLVREQAFLQPADEYAVELETLRRMHGHQLQRLGPRLRLVLTRLERGVREKRGELVGLVRARRFAGRLHVALGDEDGRGIDQLGQVLEAVRALLLRPVMRPQAARLDDVLDRLGQRQTAGRLPHPLDQRHERRDALPGRCVLGDG